MLKLFDDTLVTLARAKHPLAKRKAKAEAFAGADHIAVNSLPAIEAIDRALAADRLACNVSARVSSVLVGLLLALNTDAMLTLPASLAAFTSSSRSRSDGRSSRLASPNTSRKRRVVP